MSENCTHDCSSCSSDCASRKTESFLKAPHARSSIKKVIAVVSGKGGVGKSLTTSLLASYAHKQGKSVGIMDADITGPSIPKMFGVSERATGSEEGIDTVLAPSGIQMMSMNLLLDSETTPVVWRGPVISGTVLQFWTDVVWKDLDLLFIDMPPGTGDVPLTVFQSIPLAGVVIVTTPQDLVKMVVEKAVTMARMMKVPVPRSGGKYELFDLSGLRQKNRDIRSEQSRRYRKGVWDSRDFENAAGCGDRQTCRRGADRGLRYAVVEGSIYGDRKSVKRLSRLKKRAAAVYGEAK